MMICSQEMVLHHGETHSNGKTLETMMIPSFSSLATALLRLYTYQVVREETDKLVQLTELVDQSTMPMVMVSRTMSKEPERNSIDSTFQTISSLLKTFTIPTTETFQVMLEKPNTKADQTTSHHTSTQNSVMVNSELTLVLNQEETEHMKMFSTKTHSFKELCQKSIKITTLE